MNFTEEELATIESARQAGGNIWENEVLADIKRKIKIYFRTGDDESCCYCKRDFRDEFNMVIDIEHILPKSLYGEFMFDIHNLNISCKRCNMNIKRERHDFVVDTTTVRANYRQSNQYYFIHPNLDNYEDNINYVKIDINGRKLTKYDAISEKGRYSYAYFHLDRIEVNSFSGAQGIVVKDDGGIVSSHVPNDIANDLIELLRKL
ncbi:HNH endonuclease [Sphingobacterium multivorum]|uniref:HNH endonuclease n=1 Tax=Sphingobacterium multivorum TaxID=28454 RepID=UPI0028AC09CC|nr:HNH endonuclease [Sphingobacterium multivorum]